MGLLIIFCLVRFGLAEDYPLHYFLSKATVKPEVISDKERLELVNRIEKTLERVRVAHGRLKQDLLSGEVDLRYQEGEFWMSKLKEDEKSLEAAMEQIQVLKKRASHLVASLGLYKSMKDLSINFNAYNNIPSFSAFAGDLGPELGLWADPVFYNLYLFPLAHLKDVEKPHPPPPPKKKAPAPKGKKP